MDDYSEPLDLSLPSVKIKNHQISLDLPLDLSKKRIDNPQTIQSGPFTNSMLKNIPNLTCDKRPRIHQACTSSSLPYMNSKPRTAHSCIPVRNQYPDNYEDELESSETPFDFSCRYSETKTNVAPKGNSYKGKKSKNSNGNYSIYAETDLDQPTDYSLRYAEDDPDSDSDISEDEEKTTPAEFVGDSVKTYCTEGTPYETPFNFSTSTSMSDLRIGDKSAVDGIIQDKTQTKENIPEAKKTEKPREESSGRSDRQPHTPKMKSEFNSGLTSPEKPMNYCEEGTPGYFSRVSSFGSLNSAAAGSVEEKSSEDKLKCENREDAPKGDKMQQKMPGGETKVVKFENIVNYCEETPLMFSRSSSLGSLDSIEQSMHDGSSVISGFSRLTSGIISPSEIPDSPTQTVPPSPKHRKPSDFGMITRGPIENRRFLTARRSLPTKSSIFEDDVTKFKEESTPAQFSVATSLSSLTIDDHDETHVQETDRKGGRSNDQTADSKGDKDNMQNRCFPIPGNGQFQSGNGVYKTGATAFSSRPMPAPLSAENSTRAYNTEDTPAVLSRVGSASDLSALSMLDEEPAQNRAYLSENSSQSSGDPEGLEKEKRFGGSGSRLEVEEVWVRRDSMNKSESTPRRRENNLPPYQASTDETCRFAVEDSPAQFSLRSSLSHLTMDSEGASGFLDFLVSKETPESSRDVPDSPEKIERSVREENSNEASLAASFDEDNKIEEKTSTDPPPNEDNESVTASTENTKSFELKSDDSRCNSMKKRKWKWKWQFGSEDGQSESGESTQTDKHSTTNEEFDQGRRFRQDTNNAGSLDASFKKKKWWKWKFGLKDKDQTGGVQDEAREPDQDCVIDNEKVQITKTLEEKESLSKDCDSRNKSKRWKWKWKLNFKDDENGKTEKSLLSFSKLKHQVSPEVAKEPVCVDDVLNSKNIPKEITSLIKFMPEKHSKSGKEFDRKSKEIMQDAEEPSNNNLKEEIFVPIREKLDTPEHSDSEQSVIIEEINEQNSFHFKQEFRNLEDAVDNPSENGKKLVNTFTNQSNYASLVEECIQLGMPKKKLTPVQTVPNFRSSPDKSSEPKLKSELNKENYNIPSPEDRNILEECIQLGMRKKSKENAREDIGCAKPSYPMMKNTNRALNFDSSSLNRLSMGKTRNVFNSNDDILQNIQRRTSEKMTKPIPNEYYGDINATVDNSKSVSDKSNINSEVGLFNNGNRPEQNVLQQVDRTIPRAFVAKYNSARGDPLRRSSERTTSRNKEQVSTHKEIPAKSGCSSNSGKNPDFAALIEECIQLGMPKRKESSEGALSPNLEHHKINPAQRWPDYLYKISNENNKSASLPKPSQYSHNTQNFSSNEDFAKPASQNKRDPVIQPGLETNVNSNRFKTDVSKKNPERRGYMPRESGFNECVPKKYEDGEREVEYKESLYANVDETRSYSGSSYVKEPYYSYKSLSPEPVIKNNVKPISNKGIEKGTSALLEDCIKLGIPVKKLQDFRRTLERSSSHETSRSVKSESAQRLADSEDEAVYANTTERYYTFRNPATSEFNRSEVKPTGAKSQVVPDVMHSPVLSEKKYSPHVASIKNVKNNDVLKKIPTKSDCPDSQDFAAIIEECIQLGMPKRKEFSGETLSSNLSLSSVNSRSNSRCAENPFEYNRSATLPKGATYLSTAQGYYSSNEDFNRTGSHKRNKLTAQNVPSFGNFVQDKREFRAPKQQSEKTLRGTHGPSSRLSPEKYSPNCSAVQPDMPKSNTQQTECTKFEKPQEEEPAESLYVNVSKHAAYSRCSNRQNQTLEHTSLSNKNASSSNSTKTVEHSVEPNYSAIVEECIKLGVPSKKIAEVQNYLRNIVPGLSELSLDEKFDRPNEIERFSEVRSSLSESGVNNRIPRPTMPSNAKKSMASVQIGESNGGKTTPSSSSTIEKALEECIQLGWPKSKVPIRDDRTRFSSAPLPDAPVKKIDKAMSKNVNVASVVRNMQRQHLACSKVPTATADAEEEPERRNVSTIDVAETLTEKNGFDEENSDQFSNISENRSESEMSFAGLADVDSKLLNPHIVLASLEKYTAKLMSEAEHRLNFKNEKVLKIHPV